MFGKPEWFGKRNFGIGSFPVTWQGWAYFLGWGIALLLPFGLLAVASKWPEAAVWAVCSSAAFAWDALHLKKQARRTREMENLFYIGEEPDSQVSTNNYELNVKR